MEDWEMQRGCTALIHELYKEFSRKNVWRDAKTNAETGALPDRLWSLCGQFTREFFHCGQLVRENLNCGVRQREHVVRQSNISKTYIEFEFANPVGIFRERTR